MPAAALIVIEDVPDDFDLIVARLRGAGIAVVARRVETAAQLSRELAAMPCTAVLSDHQLPRFNSTEALRVVRAFDPDLPFIIVSGSIGEETAVELMRAGADDFVTKDRLGGLAPALQRAREAARSRRARREAEAALVESEARFRAITANLPGMVFQLHYDGKALAFDYVSAGSRRLFGLEPSALVAAPAMIDLLLIPESGNGLSEVLITGSVDLRDIHMTGHTAPPRTGTAEWIEFDASARRLANGTVQWNGIITDVSPQKRAEHELRSSQSELRDLAMHLVHVREEEREVIAREIHDDMGGSLTAVKFDLAWLRAALSGEPLLLAKLQQTDQVVDSVLHASTRIVHDLRPGIIDEGIVASLEWQARAFEQRMGHPCRFSASCDDIALPHGPAIAVFRICQEALNNVAKHAGATRVDIRLDVVDGTLALEVRDNGRGIAPGDMNKRTAFGLRGMRERAVALDGTLEISGPPGRGTSISLLLPLPGSDANDSPAQAPL